LITSPQPKGCGLVAFPELSGAAAEVKKLTGGGAPAKEMAKY
jgi:hypothetical protein